jgi:hypothetical protein
MSWPNPNPNNWVPAAFQPPKTYFALLCRCCNHNRTFETAVVECVVEPSDSDWQTRYRMESRCPLCLETDVVAVEVPDLV